MNKLFLNQWKQVLLSVIMAILFFSILQPVKTEAFAGGSGTEASPYLISNPAEFLKIANSASSHYKLVADIDMANAAFNGFGAGNQSWFTGSLDGNGFTLKNLNMDGGGGNYRGLFGGFQRNGATYVGIKNLTIENANLNNFRSYGGILGGNTTASTVSYPVLFENITVKNGTVSPATNATSNIGGLIGQTSTYTHFNGISTEITINMLNNNYTSTLNYIGGIVGYVNSFTDFTNINANGSIKLSKTNSYNLRYVGGIAGSHYNGTLTHVTNNNNIEISTDSTSSPNSVGGIVGASNLSKMDTVINKGQLKIVAGGVVNNIGGITGESSASTTSYYIDKVTNIGDILVNSASPISNIGGILGSHSNGSSFTNILNTGDITITGNNSIDNIGGIVGTFAPSSPTGINRNWHSTSNILLTSTNTSTTYASNLGGLIGYFNHYSSNNAIINASSSGTLRTSGSTNFKSRYSGGLIAFTSTAYSSGAKIENTFSDIQMTIPSVDTTNTSYFPAGLVGYNTNAYLNNSLALGSISAPTYYNDVAWSSPASTNIKKINTLTGNNANAINITEAQAKSFATYSEMGWSSIDWAINEGSGLPYLRNLYLAGNNLTKPTNGQTFEGVTIPFEWTNKAEKSTIRTSILVEKQNPSTLAWTEVGTYTSNSNNYNFSVPNGTLGNTKFRYKIAPVNANNQIGSYTDYVEFVSVNNVPKITGQFTTSEKDLTVSLEKRIMNFKVNTLVDPDSFNYVKIFADVSGISGSKKQLGANIAGPVSFTAKNYKLKIVPKFSPSGSKYDLLVVDAANENTIIATLATNRAMQAPTAPAPENLTLRVYAEDYETTSNALLSTSNILQQAFTLDTRNYLPRIFDVNHDINGRIMSANQGFNQIKFSGSVDDTDPTDGINVYYSVKLKSDTVNGQYVVNPGSDTLIKTFPATGAGTGTTASFNTTYTVQENLNNGDYVLLVYGKDTQNGVGSPVIIDFTVNKTNPDIKFFANYGGQILATPERKIVAKDSKLKMYFSAYDFTTFEYAGYLVRANQQTSSGSYEDLKIRGAYTNDVPSQFIGVDLSDVKFNKGDMLVFKFRAISSTGVKIEKTVRVLIGDQSDTLSKMADSKVPTPLLTN